MLFFDMSLQRANVLLSNLEQKYNTKTGDTSIDVLYRDKSAESEELDILHSDLERLRYTFANDPSAQIAVPLINELLTLLPLVEEKAKTESLSLDNFYQPGTPPTPEYSNTVYDLVINGLQSIRGGASGIADHKTRVNTLVDTQNSSITKHLNSEIYSTRDASGVKRRRFIGEDGNYTIDLKYGTPFTEIHKRLLQYGTLNLNDEERQKYNLGNAPAILYKNALKELPVVSQEQLLRTLNHLDASDEPKVGQFRLPSYDDIQQFKASGTQRITPPVYLEKPPAMRLDEAAYWLSQLDKYAEDLTNPHPKLRFDPGKDSLLDINPGDNKVQANEADIMHTELEILKNKTDNAGLIRRMSRLQYALDRIEYETQRGNFSVQDLKQLANKYVPDTEDLQQGAFMKEISTQVKDLRAQEPNPWSRVNLPAKNDLTGDSEVIIHLNTAMHGDGIAYIPRKDLIDGIPDNISSLLGGTKDLAKFIISGAWNAVEFVTPGEPGDKNSPIQTILKTLIDKGITNIDSWNPKDATDTAKTLDQQLVFYYNKTKFEDAKAFNDNDGYLFNVKYGTTLDDIVTNMDFSKLTKPDGENVFYGDLLKDLSFNDKKELFQEVNNFHNNNLGAGTYKMPSYTEITEFKKRLENKDWTPKESSEGHTPIPTDRSYSKYENYTKPIEIATASTDTIYNFDVGLDNEIAKINVQDGIPRQPNGAAIININKIQDRSGNLSDLALNKSEVDINAGYGRTVNVNVNGKMIDAPNADSIFNLNNSEQSATHINYDKGRVSFGSYAGGNVGKVLLNNNLVRTKITDSNGSFKYEAVAGQEGKNIKHDITIGLTQEEGDNVGATLSGKNILFGGKKLGDFLGTDKVEDGDVGVTGYRRQSVRISPFARRINAAIKGDKYETNTLFAKVGENKDSATDSSVFMKGGDKRDHLQTALEGDGNFKVHKMILGGGSGELAEVSFGEGSHNHQQEINLGSGDNDAVKIKIGAHSSQNFVTIKKTLDTDSQDIDTGTNFSAQNNKVELDMTEIFSKQYTGLREGDVIAHLQNTNMMQSSIGGGYTQLIYGNQFAINLPSDLTNVIVRYGSGPDEIVRLSTDPSGQVIATPIRTP